MKIDKNLQLSEEKIKKSVNSTTETTKAEKRKKTKNKVKAAILMQVCIFLFALSNVSFKFMSTAMVTHGLISFECLKFLAMGIGILGIYALLWQQVLKYFDLNVANAIKMLYLLWGIVFSIFILKENYKISNFIGLLFILAGIINIILKDKGERHE